MISKRINYAILVIIDLALYGGSNPVQARTIARRQSIPARFLEHVLNAMKRAGLIDSVRGAQGGYLLVKQPAEISLAQIVESVEGPIVGRMAARGPAHLHGPSQIDGLLRVVTERLRQAENDVLNRITLQELIDRYRMTHRADSQMYHI
ncbi:MAG: Rrf2 family transcriptional regulator [Nitrospiraceae bacterium]